VANKTFLVSIGDRTVTGFVTRDQMVGPWQVPVADVAVTTSSFDTYKGEAMAMGERTPVALINAAASARMAVGEAITNIAAAAIADIGDIKLSANWMAPAGHPGEDAALYDAVKAVGMDLCPQLGITIPVGKDSMSMKTVWQEAGVEKAVTAPVSLIISAFAPVEDVRRTLTPQLRKGVPDSCLIYVDLGDSQNRLGGSVLLQTYGQMGNDAPDVDAPLLKAFFKALQKLIKKRLLLAYHDRSDGGLFATLCEMAFAGRRGLRVQLQGLSHAARVAELFSEELGVVLQIEAMQESRVMGILSEAGLAGLSRIVGSVTDHDELLIDGPDGEFFRARRSELRAAWSETSFRMQSLRDNPDCALEEREQVLDAQDTGLFARLSFEPAEDVAAPYVATGIRPAVAILREQGVNSQSEMAAVFDRVGFQPFDVRAEQRLDVHATLLVRTAYRLDNPPPGQYPGGSAFKSTACPTIRIRSGSSLPPRRPVPHAGS
jgi:phosphoribosylformylglycinamidine synthase